MEKILFPFSAVVDEDDLKMALILNAIDQRIGGVLIMGPKGVAKSTIARALTDLLPDIDVIKDCPFKCDPHDPGSMCDECLKKYREGSIVSERRKIPFVNMPVTATLDRVVGSLDLKRAIDEGLRALQPGLLAEANRGIIYIDEVNLLDDSVVDSILDSAASGINVVEREGISVTHPARFILIGTMNPEEGDLRPQLKDRFGLSVTATQPSDPDELIEISNRVEEFDRDPLAFRRKYEGIQNEIRERIIRARSILKRVNIDGELKRFIADVVLKLQAGNRAMITAVKASKAIAAYNGRDYVILDDVKEALNLVLKHRVKDSAMIKGTIERESRDLSTSSIEAGPNSGYEEGQESSGRKDVRSERGDSEERSAEVSAAFEEDSNRSGRTGSSDMFRVIDHNRPGEHFDYRSSLIRMIMNGHRRMRYDDLAFVASRSRASIPVILAVDASRSMETMHRIALARGIARSFLQSAYRMRVKLSYITFYGNESHLMVEPTRNLELIEREISRTVPQGKTPIPAALKMMYDISGRYRQRTVSIMITDGRANVPLGSDVSRDIKEWSTKLGTRSDLFLISSTMGSEKFMPSYNEEICRYSGGRLIEMDGQGRIGLYSGYRRF
ncbi:magnesium chelatase subunit D family protein [Thermoplasma sp.]|uniref:magnesium chelatase subunit D family protein n=1 Tax=Thermoplasma sp. TaxID=1973142 RepID=UPI00127667F6|nr:magnesium chelatase subunit D family protein [Thermoplasma sp.]KAA8923469.1 MAG: magnesium chelatase subunit D family protein [Thermoplasma sp.]